MVIAPQAPPPSEVASKPPSQGQANADKLGEAPKSSPGTSTDSVDKTLLSAKAELFKRLPARLQGLLALGLLHSDKAVPARVIKAALASPQQVQTLMPALIGQAKSAATAQGQAQAFSSAALIRQPPTLVKLELGGHQVVTISPRPVKVGDYLALRLSQDGRLIAAPLATKAGAAAASTGPAQGNQNQQILASALRQSLPQQQPLATVLGQLLNAQALARPELKLLDASSRLLLQQISQTLAEPRQLQQAEPLRQAIGRSGLWQESHLQLLGQASNNVKGGPTGKLGSINLDNLKTQLGRLVQQLKNQQQLYPVAPQATGASAPTSPSGNGPSGGDKAIGQLLNQLLGMSQLQLNKTAEAQPTLPPQLANLSTEQRQQLRQALWQRLAQLGSAGVHKIQAQQVQGLLDSGPGQRWSLELPFVFGGQLRSVELDIQERPPRQRPGQGQQKQNQWQLRLSCDLPGLGKMQADVRLIGERGAIQLWFDSARANALAKNELQSLRQALLQGGVEVEELGCQQGLPPKLETSLQQLISTRA
ncbi:MAG: flagellar hook-length control protein FliK [Cellvibrionaceae bacterium]|nr:flagellar hook-length control protein FliK [Cellvibrionaceae bacterium]